MAETKSIKVAASTYEILKELATTEKDTMQAILDRILKEYQTKKFFESVNKAYEQMTPEEWDDEIKGRKLFENTLLDRLEEEADETW